MKTKLPIMSRPKLMSCKTLQNFRIHSTNSPDALELKCIEVWLISCTIFVFLALLEYFVVLFGIRYDKNWSRRRQDLRRAASAAQLAPPPLHLNHSQVVLCTASILPLICATGDRRRFWQLFR